jgi:hypothetical protein
MMFNATFNNISAISWRPISLMGKAGGSGETTDLLQVTYKLNYPLIGIRTHNPHHVYMSIPDRIHTCDFIGRLFLGILRIYKILQIL